jgi:predicted acylesterase/phospholipase RssA
MPPEPMTPAPLRLDDFTLALGGGGARGYAHLGVAEALAERGIMPGRIIGTSMGSVIGAGMAAGLSAERMAAIAARIDPWRMARRPARLAMFDHRPLMEKIVAEVGHPRIEDLQIPYAAATYDLVTGRHELVTSGPVADALMRSCAISVVFAPIVDGDAIWVDAGVWEPVPVSLARRWAPDRPVVGVQVIAPKPAWFAAPPLTWSLRAGARMLGTAPAVKRLTARRYSALLATRIIEPVVDAEADLLIVPKLRGVSWIRFGGVEGPRRRGYEAARDALAMVAAPEAVGTPA